MADGAVVDEFGPESVKAARGKWRRRQIVVAATRLLETQGFHQMSVNELATEAGISVGTIYQYLNTKEDILLLLIRDVLDSYMVEVPEAMKGINDPLLRLRAGFLAYCRVVDTHRAATVLAYRESRSLGEAELALIMGLEEQTTGLLRSCLVEARESGILRAHDPDFLAWDLILVAHMWSLKHWHFRAMTVDVYSEGQFRLIVGGLVEPNVADSYAKVFDAGPGQPVARARSRKKA